MVSKSTWCLTFTETTRLIRDGEKGEKGVRRWEKKEIIYLFLHCHHGNWREFESCNKVGSDESHFHVSLIVRDKVTRQCPQTTTFEEKGEPKQIQSNRGPSAYQPNALPLGQTGSQVSRLWSSLLIACAKRSTAVDRCRLFCCSCYF